MTPITTFPFEAKPMLQIQHIPPPIDDIIQPPDCYGCCHWHGKAHWGIPWVCQPCPDGWPHRVSGASPEGSRPCPHYQRETPCP